MLGSLDLSFALSPWPGLARADPGRLVSRCSGRASADASDLTANTTLTKDLRNCQGDGLVIGADNIVLNLNGHSVSGVGGPNPDDADVGIRVSGRQRVTVTNGTVEGFDLGVLLDASPDGTLRALRVRDNSHRGLPIQNGSDRALVVGNTATGNGGPSGGSGITVLSSSHAVVKGNALTGNHVGIGLLFGANANQVILNNFNDNILSAIEIGFANANTVTKNRITGSTNGVALGSADNNTVTSNVLTHFTPPDGIGIQIYGNNNLVANNIVADPLRYGIEVDDFQDPGHSPITGNILRNNVVRNGTLGIAIGPEAGGVVLNTQVVRNLVTGAAEDGIQLIGPSTGLETSTLTGNVASHNGRLGINTVPGTIDGGRNIAHANGDARQCVNITCR